MAEGGTGVVFTLATKNVAAGTTLAYTITGTGNAAGQSTTSTFTVDSSGTANSAVISVPANSTYGDSGTLVAALSNGKATSATIAVTDSTIAPVATTPTYAISASAANVDEGGAGVVFTLSTTNVAAGTTLAYTVNGTGSAAAQTSSGTFTVDASGKAVSSAIAVPSNSTVGDTGSIALSLSNGKASSAAVSVNDKTKPTFSLTTGVDNLTGTAANDTFNGQYASSDNGGSTLNGLDSIDGGDGTGDVLNVNDVKGGSNLLSGVTLKNVETININSAGAVGTPNTSTNSTSNQVLVDLTSSTISGITTVNVTGGTTTDLKAGSGMAVNVAGTTGATVITGGSTQTVTSVGALTLSKAAGAISATVSKQADKAISIDDGTSVTLTTSATKPGATTGTITVGGATPPTGAVGITSNLSNAAAASSNTTGGAITVTGGTTVSVTQTAAQSVMSTADTNSKVVQAATTVYGNSSTTSVTVNQSAKVSAVPTVLAVTGVAEVDSVVFTSLSSGNALTLAGVTLTAPSGDLTARQVAAAFANLAAGQLTGWSSGAATGANSDTVAFTKSTKADASSASLSATGSGASSATSSLTTAGVATVKAKGTGGVDAGAVNIYGADSNTSSKTIASVTLSNYGSTTIKSNALNTLSLSNSSADATSGTVTITNSSATTLDLTVNGGSKGLGDVDANTNTAAYTTLNVHVAGSTTVKVLADKVTTLSVDGSSTLDLSSSSFTALKTVTVSGSAGVTGDFSGTNVTDVNASGTSGNVKAIIDTTKATYEGGAGNDTVTISASPTKAISGGGGTDTLVLNVASSTFANPSGNSYISGFETLGLGAFATGTYDATGFSGLTMGQVAGDVTFSNVAAGTTLTFSASPTKNSTYSLKDATGTSDALTINLTNSGSTVNAGTVTAAGIESLTINASDTSSNATAGGTADSITVVATAAKTITVTGNTTLTLTSTGNTKVSSVDASSMTGGLTYTTAGTLAESVKGGATKNTLTAASGTTADSLVGGAGADTLTANAGLDVLTGNGGTDTFVIATAGTNLNTYSTITDASAGDTLQLQDKGSETFTSTKVVLGDTAVFQDYANAVATAAGDAHTNGAIGWFQFNNNTYVVEILHDASDSSTAGGANIFKNGTDIVVKLSGLIDLSTATLANIGGTAPLLLIH